MSIDREALATFLNRLADRYYAHELVSLLEDKGLITVQDVIARFEDELIEAKDLLDE